MFLHCFTGAPVERAKKILKDPSKELKRYDRYFSYYFTSYKGLRVANICGSCGKKAVPLAVLGAEVTVFDISEDNCRYAMELAAAAGTAISYVVGDVLSADKAVYGGYFDVIFMEGGILHYFHDIDRFMEVMHSMLKPGGKMICSDFHPFTKIADTLDFGQPTMSYFSTEVYEAEMPHARFFDEATRVQIPRCLYRKYTLSEILNSVLRNGFTITRFDEHPSWTNPDLPGEFTLIANKY